jgi:adenosylcobinamide-phosphate synthase
MEWVLTIFSAVLLDLYFGEPKNWHPLIAFGRFVSLVEKICFKMQFSDFHQIIIGIGALIIIIIIFIVPIYYLQHWAWFNVFFAPIILYFCIAATSLKQHAISVFSALEDNNLVLARKKVAMIVSRDCTQMDALAVRRATLESVLENGADAVFAPLFWFAIGGPLGVVLYRLSNT